MGRLVFLTYSYLPALTPRATQISRLVRHMDRSLALYCAGEKNNEQKNGAVTVRHVKVPAWEKAFIRAAEKIYPSFLASPDQFRWSARRLGQTVLRECNLTRADTVVTFSSPHSDHLAGLQIKKQTGARWVAAFSDPFTDNPFFTHGHLTRNKNLEADIFEKADRLVFTSQETIDLVTARYSDIVKKKCAVLEHSYSEAHADLKERFRDHQNDRFTIRHLGNLYSDRSPVPLLKELCNLDPALLKDVTFDFVGHLQMAEDVRPYLEKLPAGVVRITDTVPYERSLDLMHMADMLLLIEAPVDQSVFLPSKLVEYIGAGKPVLALTPEGTGARVTREMGGTAVDIRDAAAVKKVLENILSRRCVSSSGKGERFSPQTVARMMNAILDEC